MNKAGVAILATVLALALGGCVQQDLTGETYSRADAREVQQVQFAVVESVNPVVIQGRTDGVVGTGAGAIVGGLAGSTVGGGKGSDIAAVLGAVAGGIVGQHLEESATRTQGQELTLRLDNGKTISIVQEVKGGKFFHPGDRVRILRHGATTRVSY